MQTRDRLLNAAETVCRQRGYEGFSYADLSASVGIRKASIHHHFPTKADLACALIERYSEAVFARLEMISTQEPHASAQLQAYISVYRDSMQDAEQVCLCVALASDRDSLSEAVLARLSKFHDGSLGWLEGVFARGAEDGSIQSVGDLKGEAAACLALMEGAQLLARADGDMALFDLATTALQARLSNS